RTWISVVSVALGAAVLTGVNLAEANAATASGLPACKHFSPVKPPNRPPGPSHDSKSKGPKISLSGRLPAPSGVTGTYAGGKVTSYNDPGQTASGYTAGLGKCAVDARFIPPGTRFQVAGYGWCYAADIGVWIQGNIVDIWLPGSEANDWGVQQRTITIG